MLEVELPANNPEGWLDHELTINEFQLLKGNYGSRTLLQRVQKWTGVGLSASRCVTSFSKALRQDAVVMVSITAVSEMCRAWMTASWLAGLPPLTRGSRQRS